MKGAARDAMDKKRILLADDNETSRALTREILESAGYAVDTAENGLEAVEALRGRAYACVLMDAEMPVMGGLDATRAIRRRESAAAQGRTPVICITAHPETEFGDKAREAGMDECAAKPLDFGLLLARLDEWTKKRAAPLPEKAAEEETVNVARALGAFGGDRGLVLKLVSGLLETSAAKTLVIRRAIAAGDRETVAREAHYIRGGAATLAAMPLARAAGALEKAAGGGDEPARLALLCGALETELDRLRARAENSIFGS